MVEEFFAFSASIAGVLLFVGTAIGVFMRFAKSRRTAIRPYYVAKGIFSDRDEVVYEMNRLVKGQKKIINVYGKRGIGKSSFLKFYCDSVNNTLNAENKRAQHGRKSFCYALWDAYYVEVSGFGITDLKKQITCAALGRDRTLDEFLEIAIKRVSGKRRILIVLDNINNAALGRALEPVIEEILVKSDRIVVILGSIEKQALLNIFDKGQISQIELSLFSEKDIFEFAEKNERVIPAEYLPKVLDFTSGLPVFVSLVLGNSTGDFSSIAFDREKISLYIERILDDLDPKSKTLAIFIGFLSASNATVDFSMLQELSSTASRENLQNLENSSLIELDEAEGKVKMHEVFRNCICRRYAAEKDILSKISTYFKQTGMSYKQTYYLVMLGGKEVEERICNTIDQAVQRNDFSFLLLLGEHFKQLYDFKKTNTNLPQAAFFSVVYGYIEGLLGVGNYPAAREVVDTCKVSARQPQDIFQFKLSLSTAKLYQLENRYDESIASFEILLSATRDSTDFARYEAKCLWGIAHSMRHVGLELQAALYYYDQSTKVALRDKQVGIALNNQREKMSIYLLLGRHEDARCLYADIHRQLDEISESEFLPEKSSIKRSDALLKSVTGFPSNVDIPSLIESALADYKKQNKRLLYDAYFELGEYYRRNKNYDCANENYKKGLVFSRKNLDRNMESFCIIALAMTFLYSNKLAQAPFTEDLLSAIAFSRSCGLPINEALATAMLDITTGQDVDSSTVDQLKSVGYQEAVEFCLNPTEESMISMPLYLM